MRGGRPRTRPSLKGRIALRLTLLGAGIAAVLALVEPASAVPGCCSRHEGVCGCACCDGTPLSETCRGRMPACGGRETAARPPAAGFQGKVVAVIDGDTLDVLRDGAAHRIRLAGIDCPEKAQAFGAAAKQRASELAFAKTVKVLVHGTDRYGRSIGEIQLPDGRILNDEMLRAGLAWWYRDYSKDERYAALEREARAARRGLWADADPVPPWVWRRHE